MDKPPLGIIPQKEWIRQRQEEIIKACQRYLTADMKIPTEWIDELYELDHKDDAKANQWTYPWQPYTTPYDPNNGKITWASSWMLI